MTLIEHKTLGNRDSTVCMDELENAVSVIHLYFVKPMTVKFVWDKRVWRQTTLGTC